MQLALALTVLMTILAVTVDLGFLLVERRHAQATADAAALAAASDLYYHWEANTGSDPGNTALNSALGVASANGYTNDGTTSTVTVNISPAEYSGGPNAGKVLPAGYAEVTVTCYQGRLFSGILGSGALPVSARAVARGVSSSGATGMPGILLLGHTGTTLSGNGNATVTVTDPNKYTGSGASLYIDSTGPNAVNPGKNGVSAPQVFIAQTGSAPSGVTASPGRVIMGATALSDPLAYLPAPSISNPPPGFSVQNLPNIGNNTVLTSNTIYIAPSGGLSLSGNNSITGTNVMIYVPTGSINLTGNGTVSLTPMTTGPYAGVILFQARFELVR